MSDSCGRVSVLRLGAEQQQPRLERRLEGHSYEAWTTCFSAWQDTVLYSGGDDNRQLLSL